ncbi:MAG: hypothetical protein KGI80_02535 [Verrucomicrobiota bacterium]|nr:hypothetical protein [Verrucomicrobiota bacterium]
MIGEEILVEIDATLDRLIQNAEAMQKADSRDLSEMEIEAFQKTQESLLHHFLYMDRCLAEKRVEQRSLRGRIQQKFGQFQALESACSNTLTKEPSKAISLVMKRRVKKRLQRVAGKRE